MYKSWMWKQRSFREQFHGDEANGGTGGSAAVGAPTGGASATTEQAAADQAQGGEQQGGEGAPAADGETGEELIITLGDEAPPASEEETEEQRSAPQWVKDLRKEARELKKRNRELEQAAAAREAANAPGAVQVGEKPTLEGCDFDSDRFETELTAWHERKRQADDQAAKQRKEQEDAQAAWQQKLTAYGAAKTALKVPDFEDAEAVVLDTLNQTQQGILLHGPGSADVTAQLAYALGKNPAKLKELASIKDPIKFAFAAAKLETQLKVTPRKAAPAPERVVKGSAAGATGVDNTLARLEEEADRTGDRSKVIAYKREQRNKAA